MGRSTSACSPRFAALGAPHSLRRQAQPTRALTSPERTTRYSAPVKRPGTRLRSRVGRPSTSAHARGGTAAAGVSGRSPGTQLGLSGDDPLVLPANSAFKKDGVEHALGSRFDRSAKSPRRPPSRRTSSSRSCDHQRRFTALTSARRGRRLHQAHLDHPIDLCRYQCPAATPGARPHQLRR